MYKLSSLNASNNVSSMHFENSRDCEFSIIFYVKKNNNQQPTTFITTIYYIILLYLFQDYYKNIF